MVTERGGVFDGPRLSRRSLLRLTGIGAAGIALPMSLNLPELFPYIMSPAVAAECWAWPNGSTSISNDQVTSEFGPRDSPGGVGSTFHRGIDLIGFSTVKSIGPGVVAAVGYPIPGWDAGGRQVVIDHTDGTRSRYMHLASYSVSPGQQVSPGTAIGVMGATGTATGVHLHLETQVDGNSINPRVYMAERVCSTPPPTKRKNKMYAFYVVTNGTVAGNKYIQNGSGAIRRIRTAQEQLSWEKNLDVFWVGVTQAEIEAIIADNQGAQW